jgi:methanogenic corrinoid protein MtbC1
VAAGHSIGNIAALPVQELTRLAQASAPLPPEPPAVPHEMQLVEEALVAIREMNERGLVEVLTRGVVAFGQHGFLERVVGVLTCKLGELWREGKLMAAHEHFASAILRVFLVQNSRSFAASHNAPLLVVGTPAGQLHELGAVMVAAAATDSGWRVLYLGPSLPAAEIAAAAVRNRARAVALSIVYPEDDPQLPGELENLRKFLSLEIPVIAGGRAASAYAGTLGRIGALLAGDMPGFYALLDSLRRPVS